MWARRTWWMKWLDLFSTWLLSARNIFRPPERHLTNAWLIMMCRSQIFTHSWNFSRLCRRHGNSWASRLLTKQPLSRRKMIKAQFFIITAKPTVNSANDRPFFTLSQASDAASGRKKWYNKGNHVMCVHTNYKSLDENFIKMNSRSHRSKLLDNKNLTKNNKRMYGLVLDINV